MMGNGKAAGNGPGCGNFGAGMAGKSMIELEGVELTLASRAGQVPVLRGIDLAIAGGEAVGLVGPSGSGKTSLLMVMAGLERPTGGRVVIDGQDFAALSEDGRSRLRGRLIGIVFQSFHLIQTMTALENVALPLELAGHSDSLNEARSALAEVGLGHRLKHYPAELSGGEQQRVAIARAIAPRPPVLLADEPTGNLDAATGRGVIDLLFELQSRHGATLVLVTHDLALARRAGRIVEIADGRLLRGTTGEVAR
jgi:putative ABC transport system ATP-binding protein